jgi:hypothetical protein
MAIHPKWKVGIAITNYYQVEVSGSSENDAVIKALHQVNEFPDYWHTGSSEAITGLFINDRYARDFSQYVKEEIPNEKEFDDS